MSTSGNPFSAAQAMAAFNQMNASNPFNIQGQQFLSQGLTKEQANQQSAQAFAAAVQAANPHLDFSKRNLNNLINPGMVDPYQQAEEYYRRYGTGMPQTPRGSVGVDPATGQISFNDPVSRPIAPQQIGDGGRSNEKPLVFGATEQQKSPNSAATQSAAFSAASTAPTGSMFGTSNTRQQFLSPQPMNNLNSSMVGAGGTMVRPTQVNSAIQRPGGQGSGGMALEGRYGVSAGNSSPFPLQGQINLVRMAQGGPVATSRFNEEQLRGAGEFIRRNLGNPELLASKAKEFGLTTGEILAAANTVAPVTAAQVTEYFRPTSYQPSAGGSQQQVAEMAQGGDVRRFAEGGATNYSDADYAKVGEFIGKFFDTSPHLVASTLGNLGMSVADVTKAAQTVAGGQNITQGQVSDYLKTWGGNDSGGFVPEALAYLRPAPAASVVTTPAASVVTTPTWTQQNLIDAGNFIAQNMGDYGAIEAARAQVEAATGMNISPEDILAAAGLATSGPVSISKAMANVISGDVYGDMNVKGAYDWINKSIIAKPELSAQSAQQVMRELGITAGDIATAAKLDPRISEGAQYALTSDPFYQAGEVSGFGALNENLRRFIADINKTRPTTFTTDAQAADWAKRAEQTLREGLRQGVLTSGKALNEYDVQRATGKNIQDVFGSPKVTVLQKPPPLTPLDGVFVPLTAPPPGLPPGILTPGGEGIAPGTAIVGAIPEADRVKTPQLDMEFRNSAPRTAVYDRLGRVTGYEYTPAAKLTPATGTNVLNWTPPGVTSRPRQLLSMRDVPGATFDPVTGAAQMPLSASQQFARDRAQLDSDFRSMYRNLAAQNPETIPGEAPASAAKAFRDLALADPEVAQQLRLRNLDYQIADPAKADMALRAKYGQSQAQEAVSNLFTPFIDRNLATLQGLAKRKKRLSYSERRPDVAEAYAKMSAEDKTKFPTLLDYEAYHYNTFGKNEDPTLPNPLVEFGKLESPYETPFLSKGGEVNVPRETSTSKQQLDKLAQVSQRKKA